jgi:hypothetical protein
MDPIQDPAWRSWRSEEIRKDPWSVIIQLRHVIWHFGDGRGMRAGSFTEALTDAAVRADLVNLRKLARSFPNLCWSVWVAQHRVVGLEVLRNLHDHLVYKHLNKETAVPVGSQPDVVSDTVQDGRQE